MPIFPTGFDWGDGSTILPGQPIGSGGSGTYGTPTPAGALLVALPPGSTSQPQQEASDSPEIERAEQATITHVYNMAWQDGVNMTIGIGRGTFLQDSFGNITRVLSVRLKKQPKNQCQVTVIAESVSFDSPPDEFQITPTDLGLDIIKHPRYAWALAPIGTDTNTYTTVGDTPVTFVSLKSGIIRMIQTYRDSPFFPSPDQINGLIQSNVINQLSKSADGSAYINIQVPFPLYDPSNPVIDTPEAWSGFTSDLSLITTNPQYLILTVPVDLSSDTDPIAIAIAAAKEIISKLWRQEDTPYLTGFQITWTQYFFAPAYLDGGGYIQDPLTVVPDYFMQPQVLQSALARGDFGSPFTNLDTVAPNADQPTIFDKMAGLNPQAYSSNGTSSGIVNISWLRKADEMEFQRTWFRVTHTWIGSPIGNWDKDLYTQNDRPQNASDFDQLI